MNAPIPSGPFGEIFDKISQETDRIPIHAVQLMRRIPHAINNTFIAFPGILECEVSWFQDYSSLGLFEIPATSIQY